MPGKVQVLGVTEHQGEKVFALRFLQGRSPEWVDRPFLARYDPKAYWLDDLCPPAGESEFFYEATLAKLLAEPGSPWAGKGVQDD